MRPTPLGEACLCWSLGNAISRSLSERVIALSHRIRALQQPGVLDVVPTYTAIAVHFDPLVADVERLCAAVDVIMAEAEAGDDEQGEQQSPACHKLHVRYDGPDLERVAQHTGLSRAQIIARHAGAEYIVAMIGFRPHFPYLIGLDPKLATPRLDTPRTKVPAGSVAIAAQQAAVYPDESPGGWNLIGSTDPAQLTAIQPGDVVRFLPQQSEDVI